MLSFHSVERFFASSKITANRSWTAWRHTTALITRFWPDQGQNYYPLLCQACFYNFLHCHMLEQLQKLFFLCHNWVQENNASVTAGAVLFYRTFYQQLQGQFPQQLYRNLQAGNQRHLPIHFHYSLDFSHYISQSKPLLFWAFLLPIFLKQRNSPKPNKAVRLLWNRW